MAKTIDLLGQRFERLTVIENVSDSPQEVVCRCECGTVKRVKKSLLRNGSTRSCGCLQRELCGSRVRTHGMHKTPTYRSWRSMLIRCHNQSSVSFPNYGGRGVRVCDRWNPQAGGSFENFYVDQRLFWGPSPGL